MNDNSKETRDSAKLFEWLKKHKDWIVGFTLLTLIIGIAYIFLSSLIKAEANVQAAVITFIGAVIGVLFTQIQTQKREIKSRHFLEKKTAYMKLIDLTFDMLESVREKRSLDNKQMLSRMMAFKKDLLVWGDQDVIKAYNNFENFAENNHNPGPHDMLIIVDDLYRATRKDLGHNDDKLPRGTFILMQIVAEDRKKMNLEAAA